MSSVYPVSEPASVLSTKERLWYFVATNRTKIGAVILALSSVVRVGLTFQGHSDVADLLKGIADLFMIGGSAALAAGTTQNDQHFKDKKQAVIRGRSGQFRAVMNPYGRF